MASLREILIAIIGNKIDVVATNVAKTRIFFQRKRGVQDIKEQEALLKLLDRMQHPAYLFREGYDLVNGSQSRRDGVGRSVSLSSIVLSPEKPLQDLIADILTALNGVLWSEVSLRAAVRVYFEEILTVYQQALEDFQDADPVTKVSMTVPPGRFTADCFDGVYYIIDRKLALRMQSLNDQGLLNKENDTGASRVVALTNPLNSEQGVHVKTRAAETLGSKLTAADEASAADLSESVVDESISAATALGKVWVDVKTTKGWQTIEGAVQIGQSIRGELLKTLFELPQKYRWFQQRMGEDLITYLPWLISGNFLGEFLLNNFQYQSLTDEQLFFHLQLQRLLNADQKSIAAALVLLNQNFQAKQPFALSHLCMLVKAIRSLSVEDFQSWDAIGKKVNAEQMQWLSAHVGQENLYQWMQYLAGDAILSVDVTQLVLPPANVTWASNDELHQLRGVLASAGKEKMLVAFAMGAQWPVLQQDTSLSDLIANIKVFSVIARVFPGVDAQTVAKILLSKEFLSIQKSGQPNMDPRVLKFDETTLSRMTLEAMVSRPEDEKPDNDIARMVRGILLSLRIDSDRELAAPETKYLIIKTILFFMGTMGRPISSSVADSFMGQFPAVRVLDYLSKTLRRKENYETMLQSKALVESDLINPETKDVLLDLSLKFDPTAIPTTYRILRGLYDALVANKQLTHWELLNKTMPIVAQAYLTITLWHVPVSVLLEHISAQEIVNMLSKGQQGLALLGNQFRGIGVTQWADCVIALATAKHHFDALMCQQFGSRITYAREGSTIIYKNANPPVSVEWIYQDGNVFVKDEEKKLAVLQQLEQEFPGVRLIIENTLRFDALMRHLDPWELYQRLGAEVVYANTDPLTLIRWPYHNKMVTVAQILEGQSELILPGTGETVKAALAKTNRRDDYEISRTQAPIAAAGQFVEQLFSSPLHEAEFWSVLNTLGAETFNFVKKLPQVFSVISSNGTVNQFTLQNVFYYAISYQQVGAVAALVRCHGNGLDVNRLKQDGANNDVVPLKLALEPSCQNPQVLKVLLASPNLKKSEPGLLFTVIPWGDAELPKKINAIEQVLRVLMEHGFDLDVRDQGATKCTLLELAVRNKKSDVFVMLVDLGASTVTNTSDLLQFVQSYSNNVIMQSAFKKLLKYNRFLAQYYYGKIAEPFLKSPQVLQGKLICGSEVLYVKPLTPNYVLQVAVEKLRAILFSQRIGVETGLYNKTVFAPEISGDLNWLNTLNDKNQLESAGFTRLVLMALATLPGNAGENGFVLRSNEDNTQELVPLGSENPFISSLTEVGKNERGNETTYANLRSVIFCLQQMELPLAKPAIEYFLKLDVGDRLQHWITVMTGWGKSNNMQVSLPAETVASLYKRLVEMQRILRGKAAISGLELLQKVLPEVFGVYDGLFRKHATAFERAKELFSVRPKAARKASVSVHALEKEKAGLDGAMKSSANVDVVRKEIFSTITKNLRTLTEVESVQQLLSGINFKRLASETQKPVFEILTSQKSKLSFRELIVAYSCITTKQLETLLKNSPELLQLDISGCEEVGSEIIATITKYCPKLMELTANRVLWKKIVPAAGQSSILLAELRTLELTGCAELTEVKGVVAPHLKTLKVDHAPQLKALDIKSARLSLVDLADTPRVSREQIVALVAQAPALVLQGGVTGSSYNGQITPRELIAMHVTLGLPLSATQTRKFLVSGSVLDLSGLSVTNADVRFLLELIGKRQVTIDLTGCPFVTPNFEDAQGIQKIKRAVSFENTELRQIDYAGLENGVLPVGSKSFVAKKYKDVVFDAARNVLYTLNFGGTISQYSFPDFQLIKEFREPQSESLEKVLVLPNGDLVVGTSSGNMEGWNPAEGKCFINKKLHSKSVTSLIYLPTASFLVSAALDNKLQIVQWPDFEIAYTCKLSYEVEVMSPLPPDPEILDSQDFVVGTKNGKVIVHSLCDRFHEEINEVDFKTPKTVNGITRLSATEAKLAVCIDGVQLVNFDAASADLQVDPDPLDNGADTYRVISLGNGYLATGRKNGQVDVWNWQSEDNSHLGMIFNAKEEIISLLCHKERLLVFTATTMYGVALPSLSPKNVAKIAGNLVASRNGPLSYADPSPDRSPNSSPGGSPSNGSPRNGSPPGSLSGSLSDESSPTPRGVILGYS